MRAAAIQCYGPRQDPSSSYSGVISILCDRLRGRAVTIFGDGEQSRDFIFVEDVVMAPLAAMNHANIEGRSITYVRAGPIRSVRSRRLLPA